jgi:putative zinc finger protein
MKRENQSHSQSNIATNCPGDLQLAAFIDGSLSKRERESVISHLPHCRDCYQIVVGAVEIDRELQELQIQPSPTKSVQSRHPGILFFFNRFVKLKTAIAVTPLVAVIILVIFFRAEPGWRSDDLLNALHRKAETTRLIRVVASESKQSLQLGFSGGLSEQQTAYKTGSLVINLKLNLIIQDNKNAGEILQELTELLSNNSAPAFDISNSVSSGINTLPVEKVERLERYYLESGFNYFYKLGMIVETIKAYSLIEKTDLLDESYLKSLLGEPHFKALPRGIIHRFNKVDALMGNNAVAKKHEIIYKLMLEIQQILS